jgi:hypothetical protein
MILVLIESDAGEIVSDFAFCGYLGALKENWLKSNSYKIVKASINSLSFYLTSTKYEDILPIGSLEFMKKSAEVLGFEMPKPLNIPESLKIYCGRKTWTCKKNEIKYPCFIKPLDEAKLFTGFVAKKESDLGLYPELIGYNGDFFCSEVMDEIKSEWRCFVLNGKILNCSNYSGDPLIFPSKNRIEMFLNAYFDAPAGYSLDVCVTKDETNLVEINDGFALGSYGCDPQDYFKLLKIRWFEILKNKKYDKK